MRDSKTRLKNTTRDRDDDDDVAYKGIALHNCVLHGEGFANVVDCWARGRSGSLVLCFLRLFPSSVTSCGASIRIYDYCFLLVLCYKYMFFFRCVSSELVAILPLSGSLQESDLSSVHLV